METYYGSEAQEMLKSIKDQASASDESDDEKKKKKDQESKGYFSTLWKELAKGDPFGNVGRTWSGWLSEDSTLFPDLLNGITSTFWQVESLLNPETYVNIYNEISRDISAKPEDRAKKHAALINNTVEGIATTAPLAYYGGPIALDVKDVATFNANGGYGIAVGNIELMYRNSRSGGGTIFSYKSSAGKKLRVDYHKLYSSKSVFHFHTNYFGLSQGTHRSLNPFSFGQPLKKK